MATVLPLVWASIKNKKEFFSLDLISKNYLLPRALATVMARYPPTVLPSVVKLYSQKTIEK